MTDIVIPQDTKQTMSNLIDKSVSEGIEFAAPIFSDLTLGEIKEGSQIECEYPHAKGSIGLFHTHPIPVPPSSRDFVSTINDEHELMCVGRRKEHLFDEEGMLIACSREKIVSCFRFRKNGLYYSIQKRARSLNSRGGIFEDQLKKKYGYIPKRETEFTDDEYDQYRSIQDAAEELGKEFEENRNSLIETEITIEV